MTKLSNHPLKKNARSYDSSGSCKIFLNLKYIGENVLDSDILQLGYCSADSEAQFEAVDPELDHREDLQFLQELRYSSSDGHLFYKHNNGGKDRKIVIS